jgi:hypothetical protein
MVLFYLFEEYHQLRAMQCIYKFRKGKQLPIAMQKPACMYKDVKILKEFETKGIVSSLNDSFAGL